MRPRYWRLAIGDWKLCWEISVHILGGCAFWALELDADKTSDDFMVDERYIVRYHITLYE